MAIRAYHYCTLLEVCGGHDDAVAALANHITSAQLRRGEVDDSTTEDTADERVIVDARDGELGEETNVEPTEEILEFARIILGEFRLVPRKLEPNHAGVGDERAGNFSRRVTTLSEHITCELREVLNALGYSTERPPMELTPATAPAVIGSRAEDATRNVEPLIEPRPVVPVAVPVGVGYELGYGEQAEHVDVDGETLVELEDVEGDTPTNQAIRKRKTEPYEGL
jgi:hypothetical protein